MKMNYLLMGLVVLVAIMPQMGFAQCWWSYVSGDIYNINGGNVGIGTTAPGSKLEIAGETERTSPIVHVEAGDSHNADILLVDTFEDEPIFVINKDRNFGIGTSNPGSEFEIIGGVNQPTTILHVEQGDNHSADVLLIDTFEEVPLFVIDNGGNVGIGTDEPDGALHVYGDDIVLGNAAYEAQGRLFFQEHYTGAWGVSLVYNGDEEEWYSVPENCFGIVRHQDDSTGEAAVIVDRYSGNVGVGVTSPARTLHVKDVLRLGPQSSPPAGGLGDLYVGTDYKLYFHNGTAWKEVALVP